MNNIGRGSKDDPVYLYKLVRSNNDMSQKQTYKEFVLVKAWVSDKISSDPNTKLFNYLYNGRIYKNLKVSSFPCTPMTEGSSFNIWMYERHDIFAIHLCEEWLKERIDISRQKIKKLSLKCMKDREFLNNLSFRSDLI